MRFQFRKTAKGYVEESNKIHIASTPVSLGNIRRNRYGGAPNLRHQPVLFLTGKLRRQSITADDHLHGQIPNIKILITATNQASVPAVPLQRTNDQRLKTNDLSRPHFSPDPPGICKSGYSFAVHSGQMPWETRPCPISFT